MKYKTFHVFLLITWNTHHISVAPHYADIANGASCTLPRKRLDMVVNLRWFFMWNVLLLSSNFNQVWVFSRDITKSSRLSNFAKIRRLGAELWAHVAVTVCACDLLRKHPRNWSPRLYIAHDGYSIWLGGGGGVRSDWWCVIGWSYRLCGEWGFTKAPPKRPEGPIYQLPFWNLPEWLPCHKQHLPLQCCPLCGALLTPAFACLKECLSRDCRFPISLQLRPCSFLS